MVYSLLFLSLAAICNTIMDTPQFHFETSVFSKLNKTIGILIYLGVINILMEILN
jgi:hypothetical protein